VDDQEKQARFEEKIMPHLDSAYNLARWLTRNEHDAQDVVQEAFLRAFKFFGGFHGGNSRLWLLSIVRNACYDWLRRNRPGQGVAPYEEEVHGIVEDSPTPGTLLAQKVDNEVLRQAIEELPLEFRESLVMRELEGFTYKEIAEVAGVPIGTVMSRLARARDQLRKQLAGRLQKETT
jgi:RNA polymerase sigma-70 factor (ECF subfamily)